MDIKHEVIEIMGRFPDKINPTDSIFNHGTWVCSRCGRIKPKHGSCECGEVIFVKEDSKCSKQS